VLTAIDGKVGISQLSHFQPSHAKEIARAFRRKGKEWSEDTKEAIAEWVRRCEDEKLKVQEIRQLLREPAKHESVPCGCEVKHLEQLIDRGERFGTIYADPPWAYGNQSTRASTGNHYATLSIDAICDLPVSRLAAEQSHLHLWTTNAFLFDARRVIEAWGFEYKSVFVWVKPHLGIGNYWRVSHEFLLLGVRGDLVFDDQSMRSWGEFGRKKHSAKPPGVRRLIEKASPGPRLELFARDKADGWWAWGKEVPPDFFSKRYA
jgi:N6-adenosine-specific RNA methylase IME4